MLILLLRLFFVVFAVVVGFGSGQYVYRDLGPDPWFGGAMGFGIAITLIAAEQAFRRRFTRSLVAFLLGLGLGLLLSLLLLAVLEQVIQNKDLRDNLDVPLTLVTTYLVLITVLRGADRFRVVIPFVELRAERIDQGSAVIDPDALGDPRLMGLVRSGMLDQRLIIHRRALIQLEAAAAGDDGAAKVRARRALDGLAELRALGKPEVMIDETEIPNAPGLHEVLVRLCRLEGARLVATDPELLRLAAAEGLTRIDLNGLAVAFASPVRPGDVLTITVSKLGEGRGQGIGFLDDGSMVVITDAAEHVGKPLRCTVLRLHATANGRMVFAERVRGP